MVSLDPQNQGSGRQLYHESLMYESCPWGVSFPRDRSITRGVTKKLFPLWQFPQGLKLGTSCWKQVQLRIHSELAMLDGKPSNRGSCYGTTLPVLATVGGNPGGS